MTATGSDRAGRALSVTTEDLTLTVNGVETEVRSAGDVLFVEVATVRDAIRLLRSTDGDPAELVPSDALAVADLTVEVRVRRRTVAVFGALATPGVVLQRVGVPDAEIRPFGVVSAIADGVRSLRGAGRQLIR